MKSMLERSEMK